MRRAARSLLPPRWADAVRRRRQARQVRLNVDVVAGSTLAKVRWLATLPDTYRVRSSTTGRAEAQLIVADGGTAPPQLGEDDLVVAVAAGFESGVVSRDLVAYLSDASIDAVVLGEGSPPRPWRAGTEPVLAPRAIALRGAAWREVGGAPAGDHTLAGLLARVRGAGHRLIVLPVRPSGAPDYRCDPIDRPAAVILSAVPLHDVGGGSRGAQLAVALLRSGYHVAHVAVYGTAESHDLGLRFVHPHLEQYRLPEFDPSRFADRVGPDARLVVVELPAKALLDHAGRLKAAGFRVVYDLIDDWSAPSLGGAWYRPEHEAVLVSLADALVAAAPDLAASLERFGREVTLVPNAVSAAVFGGKPGPLPADFPEGGAPVIGYHGSLYGEWFDWDGLARVAEAYPQGRVVVIGDPQGRPVMPPNVKFLGLKAHHQLPAYVARFDVGLVPFVVSDLSHAVSPLKAYEYLAAGVPVAAPPLRSLVGLAGVHADPDLLGAVRRALEAEPPNRDLVLRQHSWEKRLADLLAAVGFDPPEPSDPGPAVLLRPARHYPLRERLVTS